MSWCAKDDTFIFPTVRCTSGRSPMLRELLLPTKATERKSHLLASLCICRVILWSKVYFMEAIWQSGDDVNRREVNYCSSVSKGGNNTMHNVQFVKYIFPRNRTTSDLSQNLKNTILLNIYLSQLVRVRGKYTFLSFSDFQTLDL